jgi:antitoxin HicB
MTETQTVETNTVEHYMELPYTVVLRPDAEEGDFVARVAELPGCSEHGSTPEEAYQNLQEAKRLWITTRLESGLPIPEPEQEEELPSGKFVQRLPRTLHKDLATWAKKEQVSLNQLVATALAAAVQAHQLGHASYLPCAGVTIGIKHIAAPHPWDVGFLGCGANAAWTFEKMHAPLAPRLEHVRKLIVPPQKVTDAYDPKEIATYTSSFGHTKTRATSGKR